MPFFKYSFLRATSFSFMQIEAAILAIEGILSLSSYFIRISINSFPLIKLYSFSLSSVKINESNISP